jgi:hypothetical protein
MLTADQLMSSALTTSHELCTATHLRVVHGHVMRDALRQPPESPTATRQHESSKAPFKAVEHPYMLPLHCPWLRLGHVHHAAAAADAQDWNMCHGVV